MAQQITVNTTKGSKGTGFLVVRSDATGFINLNSANPAVAANTAGETVSALYISEVVWSGSAAAASWTLARGANTVFTCYGQNGQILFNENQLRLEVGGDAQSNVAFTLSGTGNIVLKLRKQSGA